LPKKIREEKWNPADQAMSTIAVSGKKDSYQGMPSGMASQSQTWNRLQPQRPEGKPQRL
jgi:hypothetical protein